MLRGQVDEHPVHVLEAPQRLALVVDAVLRADDRDARRCSRCQRVERGRRVLALDRQEDGVAFLDLRLGGRANGDDVGDRLLVRRHEAQPAVLQRAQVVAARYGDDVVPGQPLGSGGRPDWA